MLTALLRRQSRASWLGRHWTLALAVFPAILPVGAHAESALPLEEALLLAQHRSRQLAGHDAAAQASRQMAIAAGQRPDLVLETGADEVLSAPDIGFPVAGRKGRIVQLRIQLIEKDHGFLKKRQDGLHIVLHLIVPVPDRIIGPGPGAAHIMVVQGNII